MSIPAVSGMCAARKWYGSRSLFRAMRDVDQDIWRAALPSDRPSPPKLIVLTRTCPLPWALESKAVQSQIAGQSLLVRVLSSARGSTNELVAPPVFISPSWLLGLASASAHTVRSPKVLSWAVRKKLVVLAGHTPKLHISILRFALWRGLHSVPDATVVSSTLQCNVGAYAVCDRLASLPTARAARAAASEIFETFCHSACHATPAPTSAATGPMRRNSLAERCSVSAEELLERCKHYAGVVSYQREAAAMAASTRLLPREKYLALTMRHRFCLAAPGDTLSTPKYTELTLVAAAGGCIPVIVLYDGPVGGRLPPLPRNDSPSSAVPEMAGGADSELAADSEVRLHTMARNALAVLPHARRIDWCRWSYFLPASLAASPRGLSRALHQMRAVGADEAARKQAAARVVRPRLVYSYARPGADAAASSGGSAADGGPPIASARPPPPAAEALSAEGELLSQACSLVRGRQATRAKGRRELDGEPASLVRALVAQQVRWMRAGGASKRCVLGMRILGV